MTGPAKPANGKSRRLAWVVGASAFVFLLLGGEYNTFDWLEIRRLEREEQARVAELQQTVDSLTGWRRRCRRTGGCRSGWRGRASG